MSSDPSKFRTSMSPSHAIFLGLPVNHAVVSFRDQRKDFKEHKLYRIHCTCDVSGTYIARACRESLRIFSTSENLKENGLPEKRRTRLVSLDGEGRPSCILRQHCRQGAVIVYTLQFSAIATEPSLGQAQRGQTFYPDKCR